MASTITTRPVAAQVYPWQATDTITANLTSSAAAPYALSNVIDQTFGPVMFRGGRTTDATDPSGFTFDLTATISLCAIELLNTNAASGEDVRWSADNVTTWAAPNVLDTAAWPQLPADIWTGYTGLLRSKPVRSNVLLGYDNFSTGPAPAANPTVATVTCGSGRIHFSTAGGSRTFWETSFLALGINGKTLPSFDHDSLTVATARLRSPAGGMGYKYTMAWPFLATEELAYLDGLWEASAHGNFPVFFFPVPGQRANATGIISGTDVSPQLRGGLMRLLSWTRKETMPLNDGFSGTNARLVAETWQEIAT